jgi:hypothetical protein
MQIRFLEKIGLAKKVHAFNLKNEKLNVATAAEKSERTLRSVPQQ